MFLPKHITSVEHRSIWYHCSHFRR